MMFACRLTIQLSGWPPPPLRTGEHAIYCERGALTMNHSPLKRVVRSHLGSVGSGRLRYFSLITKSMNPRTVNEGKPKKNNRSMSSPSGKNVTPVPIITAARGTHTPNATRRDLLRLGRSKEIGTVTTHRASVYQNSTAMTTSVSRVSACAGVASDPMRTNVIPRLTNDF